MAKKSIVAREHKKQKTVRRFQARMKKIKTAIQKAESTEERYDLIMQQQKLPRNASPSRVRRRCMQCGRPRGVYRLFGLCRICLRQAAMRGDIPGLEKASW